MPGIFDDARRGSGPLAPDPCGTGPIFAKRIDNSVPDPKQAFGEFISKVLDIDLFDGLHLTAC